MGNKSNICISTADKTEKFTSVSKTIL